MKPKLWRKTTASSLLLVCLAFGCGCEDEQVAYGRPCEVDADDCPDGYTCASTEDTAQGDGVCVLLADVDAGTSADAGNTDAMSTDSFVPTDAAQPDTAGTDAAQPDSSVPTDAALPDTAGTDAALPDTAGTDAALPDSFVPIDAAHPDSAGTDAAQSDSNLPIDAALPDVALPDTGQPDTGQPDTSVLPDAAGTDAFVPTDPRLIGWQRSQLVPLGMESESGGVKLRGRLLSGYEQDSSEINITLRGRILIPAHQD